MCYYIGGWKMMDDELFNQQPCHFKRVADADA